MKHATTLAALAIVTLISLPDAQAATLDNGLYILNNHPDGNQRPPSYGLRLDGLIGNPNSDTFTFDFDHPDSGMSMIISDAVDAGNKNIRIFGFTYGGLDRNSNGNFGTDTDNNGYSDSVQGTWFVDFTYLNVPLVPGDDDRHFTTSTGVSIPNGGPGIGVAKGTISLVDVDAVGNSITYEGGTITANNNINDDSNVIDLIGQSNSAGLIFRLGDENNDAGHRGFNGISGWGWVNHDARDPGAKGGSLSSHIYASDFLFTATPSEVPPIPLPAAAWAGLAGFSLLAARKKFANPKPESN